MNFDEFGLLPPGIHDMTLDEIEQHFGQFQRSNRRIRLFERLRKFVEELRKTSWKSVLLVNGSFAMNSVDEPSDIDLVLILPDDWNSEEPVRPFEYNVLSKKRVRRRYRFDLFVVLEASASASDIIDFFQQVTPKWQELLGTPADSRKGLVRVIL